MSAKKVFHKLRLVAAFGLLGAVVFGALFHGIDLPVDIRACGAAAGAALASLKMCHAF